MSAGVGVIGAGIVGGGVINTLKSNAALIAEKAGTPVSLVHVSDVRTGIREQFELDGVTVGNDAKALIADPKVQIVCELIGGLEPARTFILAALNTGKHVVTANKMLLAHHGPELCKAAVANKVELRYEAAVAGGIPIIKALREGLAANRFEFVCGILNGTCNYILTHMTYGDLEFDVALTQAQAKGFAETPPDLDIDGHDTAHKCQILASLCYSTEVSISDIHVEGVRKVSRADVAYARELGYLIKLLAILREDGREIEVRVHPTLVPEDHLLASVRNEFNAIYVKSDVAGATLYYGRGAGRMPTASAVVADIIDIARRGNAPVPPPFNYTHKRNLRDMGNIETRYYLRLNTIDKPGVLGRICTLLGNHGVSIASCMQKEEHDADHTHIVLMTAKARERDVMNAVKEIDSLDIIQEPTHLLRVLES